MKNPNLARLRNSQCLLCFVLVFTLSFASVATAAHQLEHAVELDHHQSCQLGHSFSSQQTLLSSHSALFHAQVADFCGIDDLSSQWQQTNQSRQRCRSPPKLFPT